jgi:hypothetical protein
LPVYWLRLKRYSYYSFGEIPNLKHQIPNNIV